MNATTQTNQANVEYFFRLLYDCLHGSCYGSPSLNALISWVTQFWLWIIILGYLLALIGFLVIVYTSVRLFEIRKREDEFYGTLLLAPEQEGSISPRWRHIESLMNGDTPSEWREAIVEADIMLDDMLTKQGYIGDSLGEKLKLIERSDFNTLDDAWEAHKVRNQIAHEGSTFDLTESLARRTIARYENVFREFSAI